ncbi:MAG: DUF3237 family protein [Clostridia bacterium]|nr:DUF3237 family protein [Clostridia bacterium]
MKTGKLIMTFHVSINRDDITEMIMPSGKVTFIPFEGHVESELFTGTIRPGAADVQVTNAAGIRHMQAKYIFDGTDKQGRHCHLYVENNGYFEPDSEPSPFHACPAMMSDSAELNRIISGVHFRAEGHGTPEGVDILIFDTEG